MGSTRVSRWVCIAMLVAGAAVVPAAVTAQQDQVTITVTVVDQSDRTVGSGVDVTATWEDGSARGTTAANGQVLLDVPRGADVALQVDDDRYVRNIPYDVDDARTQSVEMPVAQSATAEITVRNSNDEPVEDARVLLYRGGQFVTDQRTGADGTVTTPDVAEGRYRLDILKSGYFTNQTRVNLAGADNVTQRIEQGEILLTVSVVDDYFEPPEPLNASVRIPGVGTLQTGEDGAAATTVPVNSRYDIVVTRDGYEQSEQRVSVAEADTNASVSITRTDRIDIDSQNQTIVDQPVRIEATDEYGDPVANATVTRDGEAVGTTNEDGVISVTPASTGLMNYTVDDGDTQTTVSIEVFDTGGQPTETASPTPTDPAPTETGTSSGFGPGFTPLTVAAAAVALALVAARRR